MFDDKRYDFGAREFFLKKKLSWFPERAGLTRCKVIVLMMTGQQSLIFGGKFRFVSWFLKFNHTGYLLSMYWLNRTKGIIILSFFAALVVGCKTASGPESAQTEVARHKQNQTHRTLFCKKCLFHKRKIMHIKQKNILTEDVSHARHVSMIYSE